MQGLPCIVTGVLLTKCRLLFMEKDDALRLLEKTRQQLCSNTEIIKTQWPAQTRTHKSSHTSLHIFTSKLYAGNGVETICVTLNDRRCSHCSVLCLGQRIRLLGL